eukprot:3811470-Heterocapsa_arctica.AAC.1
MVVDGLTKELDDQSPLRKLAEGMWHSSGTHAMAPMLYTVMEQFPYLLEDTKSSTIKSAHDLAKTLQGLVMFAS